MGKNEFVLLNIFSLKKVIFKLRPDTKEQVSFSLFFPSLILAFILITKNIENLMIKHLLKKVSKRNMYIHI